MDGASHQVVVLLEIEVWWINVGRDGGLSPDNVSAVGGKPLWLMVSVFGRIDPVPVTTLWYLL